MIVLLKTTTLTFFSIEVAVNDCLCSIKMCTSVYKFFQFIVLTKIIITSYICLCIGENATTIGIIVANQNFSLVEVNQIIVLT